jgi:hypothetical protein
MKNKLVDLNNHMFEQLERLNDDELIDEKLDKEISRSKAMTSVAQTIINNATLMFSAQKFASDNGYAEKDMPDILKLDVKSQDMK